MRSLEALTNEHGEVKSLIEVLEAAARRLHAGARVPTDLLGDILAALARCIEQVHMAKEERVVFPYLHNQGLTRSTAVVAALSEQHEAIRVYGRRMRAACDRLVRGDRSACEEFCGLAEHFIVLVREHVRIEEQYFYELADQTVRAADHDRITARFHEIDLHADAPGARAFAERVLARCRAELSPDVTEVPIEPGPAVPGTVQVPPRAARPAARPASASPPRGRSG